MAEALLDVLVAIPRFRMTPLRPTLVRGCHLIPFPYQVQAVCIEGETTCKKTFYAESCTYLSAVIFIVQRFHQRAMIIEIFTYTDEVITLLFQVLTNEFRAIATWAVCVQFYSKNLLRQPIHIQGCSRKVALFTHVEQPFACQSDIIEFQKSLSRIRFVVTFSPPVDVGAVSSNREPSVVADNYCCSKSDARLIALSCCRHHIIVRIEIHGVAFPSSHQCRHLIDACRHFTNNLLNGHSRPPSIKVGNPITIMPC